MEKEDYVSYEVAMKLKEKGYDEDCHYVYTIGNKKDFHRLGKELQGYYFSCNSSLKKEVTAPSLYDAQKWLRKKYIFIDIDTDYYDGFIFNYTVFTFNKRCETIIKKGDGYDSYEEALNEGIEKALEYL